MSEEFLKIGINYDRPKNRLETYRENFRLLTFAFCILLVAFVVLLHVVVQSKADVRDLTRQLEELKQSK